MASKPSCECGTANIGPDTKAAAHSDMNTRYGDFKMRMHGKETNTDPKPDIRNA